jgi:hypothetical protein
VFAAVEETTENAAALLQRPPAAQQALIGRYDGAPYVPAADAGSIPFLDIGNRYLVNGAQSAQPGLHGAGHHPPGRTGRTGGLGGRADGAAVRLMSRTGWGRPSSGPWSRRPR